MAHEILLYLVDVIERIRVPGLTLQMLGASFHAISKRNYELVPKEIVGKVLLTTRHPISRPIHMHIPTFRVWRKRLTGFASPSGVEVSR